jgi:parvulin-like peptidyl-prolyl isomerase
MSCEKTDEGKVVAKVDQRVLTEEDIDREIPTGSGEKVTVDQKREYVRRWIRNELLYQEALKSKIDQEKDIKQRLEQITKDFVVTNFVEKEFADSFSVLPEEIKEYYENNKEKFVRDEDEIRASHILLKNQEEAELVRTKLVFGADLGRLAAEESLDPDTKFRAGDLGYFARQMAHPAIAEAAFKLEVGYFSKPIETEWGFHVIKVTDKKKKGSIRELWEMENLITNLLSNQKRKEVVDRYIESLEGKYDIRKYGWAAEDTT